MGWGSLFGKAATLGLGTPFAGFFVETGFKTLKTLFPSKQKSRSRGGGADALDEGFAAGSTINVIPKRQQIPAVCGLHRITLPAVAPAYTEMVRGFNIDTYQVFGMHGPVDFKNIYINGALSTSFDSKELEIQTRQGFDTDDALTLVSQSAFEEIFDEILPDFQFQPGSTRNVSDQTDPDGSRPTWVTHASKPNADEIWFDLDTPNGANRLGDDNTIIPFRVRIREVGSSTWRNFPEMRIRGNYSVHRRFRIKLKFEADPGGGNPASVADYTFPCVLFNRNNNGFGGTNIEWLADPYFGPYENDNVTNGQSETLHFSTEDNECTFYLDPADGSNPWPKGEYEISVQRGWSGRNPGYSGSNNQYYAIEGSAGSFAIADSGNRVLPEASELVWHSITTVRSEHPINATGFALIAIRARNIQLNSISAEVQGLTDDLVGGVWVANQETRNPASWARRLRTEPRLAYAMPDEIRSDDDFAAWHAQCAADSLTFDMVVEGNMTISNLFGIICEAGYAKPRYGATEGVWLDFDRSSDDPKGAITPHNSRNFSIAKPMAEVPEAFAVSWFDSSNAYEEAPDRVRYRSGFSASTVNLKRQALVAPGKVTAADVDEWADRKLAEYAARTAAFRVEIDWEHLQFDVGDLVAVAWNTLGLQYQSGVVESVVTSGGNVTGLRLREKLEVEKILGDAWSESDLWLKVDAWSDVSQLGLGIRYEDGTVVHHEITNTTDSQDITFTTPFAEPGANPSITGGVDVWAMPNIWTDLLKEGSLVWCGPLDSEERRCILTAVEGRDQFGAVLTLVDEAPTIHP